MEKKLEIQAKKYKGESAVLSSRVPLELIKKIDEVAEQTGFGSDTYMTRVFKQKMNTTPGKYRHK